MRGLLVGRFQPFHLGHLAVVRAIRATRPDDPLILGVGSAQASYSGPNPFTAGERIEMIEAALDEADLGEVLAIPIPDIDRHALWAAHVESLVPRFERVYTNNPLTRVLFERAGYTVVAPELVERSRFEGVRVRQRLAADDGWRDLVPPAVGRVLVRLRAPERLALLRETRDPGSSVGGA